MNTASAYPHTHSGLYPRDKFAVFPFNGQTLIAKITAQKYKRSADNRIYLVEALEVAEPEGNLTPEERGVLSGHDGRTPIPLKRRLLQMAAEVNLEKQKQTRRRIPRPSTTR